MEKELFYKKEWNTVGWIDLSLIMFLTHLKMKTFLYQELKFSMENQVVCRSELSMTNIINMTLKN